MNFYLKSLYISISLILGMNVSTLGNEVVYDNADIFTAEQREALIKLLLDYERYSQHQIVLRPNSALIPIPPLRTMPLQSSKNGASVVKVGTMDCSLYSLWKTEKYASKLAMDWKER